MDDEIWAEELSDEWVEQSVEHCECSECQPGLKIRQRHHVLWCWRKGLPVGLTLEEFEDGGPAVEEWAKKEKELNI
tara:strand:- start:117 stop:344 length:228 start_codon:yes stop_codon:yes gene_type:complete